MWKVARDLLVPNIRNVMQGPNPLSAARCLLHNDQILANAAAPIAHAYAHLVPDNQVNDVQIRSIKPRTNAGAEMEFVRPKEQMASRHKHAINPVQELFNL